MSKAPEYIADFSLFRGFSAYPTNSWGDADLLALFRELTRWRLSHSEEAPELDSPMDSYRLAALQFIGELFRWLCVGVVISGVCAWSWNLAFALRRRRFGHLFVVSTAALVSALAVLTVNLLVDALAFQNRGPTALHEGYPLLVLFGVTAWANVLARRTVT